jgi:uncharacterized membrane protein
MLIPIPIGLWVFSFVADVTYRLGGDPVWIQIAFWTMFGGTIGALLAAVPGLIDYFSLRDRRAVRIATMHLTLNLIIVGLFVVNLVLRRAGDAPGNLEVLLSGVGCGLLLVSGWLGGELIYGQGVGLSPEIEVRSRRADRGAA